eukprot:jgi/Tetstr1/447189/TSEL_034626.t1
MNAATNPAMNGPGRVSGTVVSVSKSRKSHHCRHVRLSEHPGTTFTLYLDHPSFADMYSFPKTHLVTLAVAGRVIRDFFSDREPSAAFRAFLSEMNVLKGAPSDRKRVLKLFEKISQTFPRKDPVDVLRSYPYYAMSIEKVARVYDFDAADAMCEKLGHSIQKRCRGHCHYKIKDVCDDEGHTCLPYDSYKHRINGFPGALVTQQIDVLIRHGTLVCHNDHLFTADTFRRETAIRNFLRYQHEVLPLEPHDAMLIPGLSEQQALILDLVALSRISVLAGGAGTGKTRCIAAITCAFANVTLAAPTGKAARRIVQSCRDFNPTVDAVTLHSLLAIGGTPDNRRQAMTKIPRNGLLVIDEASMLDLDVMYAVVEAAVELNLSLLLVGDPNQLPPVSRGDVFSNIIAWAVENACIVELDEIHRQAESNPIYRMGHHIFSGLPAENVLDHADGDLLQFHETRTYAGAIEKAIAVRREYMSNVFDTQIVSPWKRVVASINQAILGPDRGLRGNTVSFRPGDFVMCKTNISAKEYADFQNEEDVAFPEPRDAFVRAHVNRSNKMMDFSDTGDIVTDTLQRFQRGVNGHCGILLNANVLVDDNSDFVYIGNDKSHASAITVHKSQGSEWPTVILVVHNPSNQASGFLNKKLLYTAVTRAKKRLVIIGQPEAVQWAVERAPPKRHTLSYT